MAIRYLFQRTSRGYLVLHSLGLLYSLAIFLGEVLAGGGVPDPAIPPHRSTARRRARPGLAGRSSRAIRLDRAHFIRSSDLVALVRDHLLHLLPVSVSSYFSLWDQMGLRGEPFAMFDRPVYHAPVERTSFL